MTLSITCWSLRRTCSPPQVWLWNTSKSTWLLSVSSGSPYFLFQPGHLLRLRLRGRPEGWQQSDPRLQRLRHGQPGARPGTDERRCGGHSDQQCRWGLVLPHLSPGQPPLHHHQHPGEAGQEALRGGGLRVHLPGGSGPRPGWVLNLSQFLNILYWCPCDLATIIKCQSSLSENPFDVLFKNTLEKYLHSLHSLRCFLPSLVHQNYHH